jgi:hypothetical protein
MTRTKTSRTDVAQPPPPPLETRFTVRAEPVQPAETEGRWQIVDGTGQIVVADLQTRKLAIRAMGSYANDYPLPLRVRDKHGQPTGDRLG